MTSPDSPKGPEREARPGDSLEDRVAEYFRVEWGYSEMNEWLKRSARAAVIAVTPELERLTFERDAAQATADNIAQQLEDLRDDVLGDGSLHVLEVASAAGRELERLTAEVAHLRAQLAPAKLGAETHQERADQLVIGLRRLLDKDHEIENSPARSATSEAPAESDEFAMTLRPEGLRPSGSEAAEPQRVPASTPMPDYRVNDEVEWNPSGDTWKPGVVTWFIAGAAMCGIELRDGGSRLTVSRSCLRPARGDAASAARREATPENPPTRAIVSWEPGERVEYDLCWDGRVCAVPGAVIGDGGTNTEGVHRTAVQTGRMLLGVVYIENHLLRCPREVTEFCGAFDIATDVSMKPCHEKALSDSNRCAKHSPAVAAAEAEPNDEDVPDDAFVGQPDPAHPAFTAPVVRGRGVAGEADTSPQPRVWAPGSPAPGEAVTKVIAENDVRFKRTPWGDWEAQPPEGNGRSYSWARVNELMTVTEVLPAVSSPQEGDEQ